METLPFGFTLNIPEGCFPLSTDSMVLCDTVKLKKNASVLDLGSGCGTLGLLLSSLNPGCRITGIEISEQAHQAALGNIAENHLTGRMESLCKDLRSLPSFLTPGSYDCCISNPPYFTGGPASRKVPQARRDDLCSCRQLMKAAAWALKFGGDFYLVQKPERLGELIGQGAAHGLECKQLTLVRHRQDGPVSLVLLQFRKGAKPGLILKEISLHDYLGEPTKDYRRIYHLEEA